MFQVEKLKPLTRDTALTFISETVTPCLGNCLKKNLNSFKAKTFPLFKYKIHYKNHLLKN